MKNVFLKLNGILLMMVLLCGCGGAVSEKALEQKYGEHFTVTEAKRYGEGYLAWAVPDSNPNIVVKATLNGDGSQVGDDYGVKSVCYEVTKMAEEYTDEYVFTSNAMGSVRVEKGITPEQFLMDDPNDEFHIKVFAEEGTDLRTLYDSAVKIRGIVSRCSVDVYLLEKDDLLMVKKNLAKYAEVGSDTVKEAVSRGHKCIIDTVPTFEEFERSLSGE